MPWWETVKDGEVEEVDEIGQMVTEFAGRPCKFGIIVQVGYLLENEHGMWFGVGPKSSNQFEDIGEWKSKKRKSARREHESKVDR